MSEHIIAIASYGSHRVKHPQTGQTISAYKMGYSSAASAVLLALYGSRARDVSSKQASYHYIQINAEVTIRHGYILLKVSDTELAQVEALTRQTHRPAVYRWLDGAWYELPSQLSADYQPPVGRSGPNFNPIGMQMVSASTGEIEAAIAGIVVEKSQRSANDTPWYWLRGDTYSHRETLKRCGCRWSKKRKSWYFIGVQLPDAVQVLIDEVDTQQPETVSDENGEPCSVEEAAAILGLCVKDQPSALPKDTDVMQQSDDEETEQLPDEPDDVPKIRIIKPVLDVADGDEPDAIVTAVRETRPEALPVIQSSIINNGRRNLVRIPQAPCGELTGSISGNVWIMAGPYTRASVCISTWVGRGWLPKQFGRN